MTPILPAIRRLPWPTILLLSACLWTAGCLSKPPLIREHFLFEAPDTPLLRPASAPKTIPAGSILHLKVLGVAAPFDTPAFTYRLGDHRYERDPYAAFLIPPGRTLGHALRQHLRRPGSPFADCVESGRPSPTDWILEVQVAELWADFTPGNTPTAALSMHLRLRPSSAPDWVVDRMFRQIQPIPERSAAGVMQAWNLALEEGVMDFVRLLP